MGATINSCDNIFSKEDANVNEKVDVNVEDCNNSNSSINNLKYDALYNMNDKDSNDLYDIDEFKDYKPINTFKLDIKYHNNLKEKDDSDLMGSGSELHLVKEASKLLIKLDIQKYMAKTSFTELKYLKIDTKDSSNMLRKYLIPDLNNKNEISKNRKNQIEIFRFKDNSLISVNSKVSIHLLYKNKYFSQLLVSQLSKVHYELNKIYEFNKIAERLKSNFMFAELTKNLQDLIKADVYLKKKSTIISMSLNKTNTLTSNSESSDIQKKFYVSSINEKEFSILIKNLNNKFYFPFDEKDIGFINDSGLVYEVDHKFLIEKRNIVDEYMIILINGSISLFKNQEFTKTIDKVFTSNFVDINYENNLLGGDNSWFIEFNSNDNEINEYKVDFSDSIINKGIKLSSNSNPKCKIMFFRIEILQIILKFKNHYKEIKMIIANNIPYVKYLSDTIKNSIAKIINLINCDQTSNIFKIKDNKITDIYHVVSGNLYIKDINTKKLIKTYSSGDFLNEDYLVWKFIVSVDTYIEVSQDSLIAVIYEKDIDKVIKENFSHYDISISENEINNNKDVNDNRMQLTDDKAKKIEKIIEEIKFPNLIISSLFLIIVYNNDYLYEILNKKMTKELSEFLNVSVIKISSFNNKTIVRSPNRLNIDNDFGSQKKQKDLDLKSKKAKLTSKKLSLNNPDEINNKVVGSLTEDGKNIGDSSFFNLHYFDIFKNMYFLLEKFKINSYKVDTFDFKDFINKKELVIILKGKIYVKNKITNEEIIFDELSCLGNNLESFNKE